MGPFLERQAVSQAGVDPSEALLIDSLLLVLFGLQHSGMARARFKRWWTSLVPSVVERSTYVLCSGIALGLLIWLWQPLPAEVWRVEHPAGIAILLIVAVLGVL